MLEYRKEAVERRLFLPPTYPQCRDVIKSEEYGLKESNAAHKLRAEPRPILPHPKCNRNWKKHHPFSLAAVTESSWPIRVL
jgi:hypothetical protein